jgi:hypothetical protein
MNKILELLEALPLPKIRIPISRKVVSQGIVGGVTLGLGKLGLYDLGAWLPWVSTGAGLAAGVAVPEAVKFLDYAAERLGFKMIDFTDADVEALERPSLETPAEAK